VPLTGCADRWVRGGGEGRAGALSPGRAAPAAEACPPRSMSRLSHARRVVMVADQPLDPVGEVVSLLMNRSALWW
jgi:hypothetical protein